VDDIYRKLRIPAEFIENIESGKVALLPAMCYTAGFLKTYCQFLGVDPEPYFDSLKDCARPAAGFLGITKGRSLRPRPVWLTDMLAWGAVCAILILGWVTYTIVFQPAPQGDGTQVQADTLDLHVPDAPLESRFLE